ncbi:MAG: NHL repeat-containing protein [Anaerolineae bacterium]
MLKYLIWLPVTLLLLLAACAPGGGPGARLPDANAPAASQAQAQQAQVPQAPQAQAPQTQAQAPQSPGQQAQASQAQVIPTIMARATSSVPLATPLPTLLTITAGDGNLRRPSALALDKDGNIYVGDQLGVYQFDPSGKYVKTLVKVGADSGLRGPSGLAVTPNGDIYIADNVVSTVFHLTPDGKIADKITSVDGQPLDQPVTVTADPQGNIYVVNQNSAEVLKLDPKGKVLTKIGSKGDKTGEFMRPHALALDKDGDIYVTDLSTSLIQKFGADGKYVKTFGDSHSGENAWLLRGVAVGPDNRLYTIDSVNQRIQMFDLAELRLIKEFQNPGMSPGQFQDPAALAVDAQGNLYIADRGNNRIQKLKLTN